MNHRFEDMTAGKIKNGESIIGNLKYGQAIKLSAAKHYVRLRKG